MLCASRMGAHGDLPGTLEQAVSNIQASGGKATAVVCDLSDASARVGLIERASQAFGPIDILVNNAAGSTMKLPSQCTTEDGTRLNSSHVVISYAVSCLKKKTSYTHHSS